MKQKNNYRWLLLVAMPLLLFSGCNKKVEKTKERIVNVKTVKPQKMDFTRTITVQGNVESCDSVKISSKTSGTVDLLCVSTGSIVKKGQLLFQVDKSNLEKRVSIAKQELEVNKATLKAKIIDYKIAMLTMHKAEKDFSRAHKLVNKRAISTSNFEVQELNSLQAKAMVKKAAADVEHAQAKFKQARNNLAIANKDLEDSLIRSPFDGVIVQKDVEADEYVTPSSSIITIEDPSRLELKTMISSIYYNDIISEATKAIIKLGGRKHPLTLPVTYKSPSVDKATRTFEVKIKVPKGSHLVSGMLCDVTIVLKHRKGIGVSEAAVMDCAGKKHKIFYVDNDKSKEFEVKTGLTTDGMIEILNPGKISDRMIIIQGQNFLNNDDRISLNNVSAHQ
ncbi:MAG: efflux RND transporter periplasmic adaptor subunit [Lentisphaerae bacterium]|nr:efflux RND transporter periplasmic adaptor subunit [Lentisphaerota bacterium]MCP4101651.1 efflux RND transporter periplasmic adaptor subunit [Lentisphaerota bacterium]